LDPLFPELKTLEVCEYQNCETFIGDIQYKGVNIICFDASILVNWPIQELASLPLSVEILFNGFSGKLCAQFSNAATGRYKLFFQDLPKFDLQIVTVIGADSLIQKPPKVEEFIVAKIMEAVENAVVWPSFLDISLPLDLLD
jgi:hypothetical protein